MIRKLRHPNWPKHFTNLPICSEKKVLKKTSISFFLGKILVASKSLALSKQGPVSGAPMSAASAPEEVGSGGRPACKAWKMKVAKVGNGNSPLLMNKN